MDSAVRGYHLYKDVWKPAMGEKLHAEQEPDKQATKYRNGSDLRLDDKIVKVNNLYLIFADESNKKWLLT